MLLVKQLVHHRLTHFDPLVLEMNFFNSQMPVTDRDQTVLRRSKPKSRTSLIGEQPNPWDQFQPQDEMTRHRGAKRLH